MIKRFGKLAVFFGCSGCLSLIITAIIISTLALGLITNTPETYQQSSSDQKEAQIYDASKADKTIPIQTNGADLTWVNKFRLDAADPPFVTGRYIDNWLRANYPDSPLIGYGDTIKRYADHYGVAVGAFMGQIAKETTFGRASCGGRDNIGCIRWYEGSNFGAVDTAYGKFQDIQDIETGIESYFHLVRNNYIDTGQSVYKDYLDKYSPASDGNDHTSFKSLMWGMLKSFGYDTADTTRKTNHASKSETVDGKIDGRVVSNNSASTRSTSTNSGGTTSKIDLENTRLPEGVLKWKDRIAQEMSAQGVSEEYLPYVLAIVAVESGGGGVADIFQSSESKGLPPNTLSTEESIIQGITHFKNTLEKANTYGKSIWAVLAGYNFGHAFLDYLNKNNLDWTIKVAEEYSATVVAPSLGNTSRETLPYVNELSTALGIPYMYRNGGNFHYVPKAMWYLGFDTDEIKRVAEQGGDGPLGTKKAAKKKRYLFNKFVEESDKKTSSNGANGDLVEVAKSQIGLPYSWGGGGKEGPSTGIYDPSVQDATNIVGFDCSGFMQYIYWQTYGVDIGDWTVPQESSGKRVSKDALEVGDLLFWGPPGATYHVAMYIGNNELIESSTPGNPVGIHPMRDFDFAVRPDISKKKGQ